MCALVRCEGLAASLSSCLIRRITEHPAIRLRTRTEPTRRDGAQRCERVRWRGRRSVRSETRAIRHVFVMVGVTPGTGWLAGCPGRSPSAARREYQARRVGRRSGSIAVADIYPALHAEEAISYDRDRLCAHQRDWRH